MLIRKLSCIALLLCLICTGASAKAVTPTPTPVPMPGSHTFSSRPTLMSSATVEIRYWDVWIELDHYMLYAHTGGMMADGLLMFMPPEAFFEAEEITVLTLTDSAPFSFRAASDMAGTEVTCIPALERKTEEGLQPMDVTALHPVIDGVPQTDTIDPSLLESGLYLFSLNTLLKRGDDCYSAMSYIWLDVK